MAINPLSATFKSSFFGFGNQFFLISAPAKNCKVMILIIYTYNVSKAYKANCW